MDLPFCYINQFSFCEHGNEVCNECCMDMRAFNNDCIVNQVQDESLKAYFKDHKRRAIMDVCSSVGAVATRNLDPKLGFPMYECKTHGRLNCPEICFNWPLVISKMGSEVKDSRSSQLLSSLNSMGVKLPADLGTKSLEKKLDTALKMSQKTSSLGDGPVNPSKIPVWNKDPNMKRLLRAFSWNNDSEEAQVQKKGLFLDIRQMIWSILKTYQAKGLRSFVFKDEKDTEAIILRIVDVRQVTKSTPLISVVFETGRSDEPVKMNSRKFLSNLLSKGGVPEVTCSCDQQALLRRVLHQNSLRLSPEYKPKKESFEEFFDASFLVPFSILTNAKVEMIESELGCEVCGEKASSRCSSCHSVSYCGADCQKTHWKKHKALCHLITDGKWVTLNFTTSMKDGSNGERLFPVTISNSSGQFPSRRDDPRPNIHADRPFLVKIQRSLPPEEFEYPQNTVPLGGSTMLVYDQQRSFQGHAIPDENSETYGVVIEEMMKGENTLKMYRWVKKVGELQLSVCLDGAPEQIPSW